MRNYSRLLIFSKINFFEKIFKEYHQSVKQIGSRSDLTFCVGTVCNCYQQTKPEGKKHYG